MFDYKYITFDDSAVFEITDAIKNGNYTTIIVQYLSNISFDTADSNFRVDAGSARRLQDLGLDLNKFVEILGNKTTVERADLIAENNSEPFLYAIKIRVSEMPQNLKYRLIGDGRKVAIAEAADERNIQVHNPSLSEYDVEPTDFLSNDSAISLFLFMPATMSGIESGIYFNNGNTHFEILLYYFFETLNVLITDLTLSVEITPVSEKTLYIPELVSGVRVKKKMQFNLTSGVTKITLPVMGSSTYLDRTLWSIRVVDSSVQEDDSNFLSFGYPVFTTKTHITGGFQESYNFIKLDIERPQNESILSIEILGNTIDVSKLRNDFVYLKRQNKSIRVYIDLERNIYTDIQTTLEYAKNAYSNYEAYQKSNIDLINAQELATLKQTQTQARELQDFEHLSTGAKSVGAALFSLGIGNIAGAAGMALGAGANMAIDEKKHNLKTQNDTANQRLNAAQAHEKRTATITPSSDLQGSINLQTSLRTKTTGLSAQLTLATITTIAPTAAQFKILQKYVFENTLLEKITDISQIQKPEWASSYYQTRICNRSALNTRKDLIVFTED